MHHGILMRKRLWSERPLIDGRYTTTASGHFGKGMADYAIGWCSRLHHIARFPTPLFSQSIKLAAMKFDDLNGKSCNSVFGVERFALVHSK